MVKKLINIINSQLDCDIPDARSAISLSEKAIISLEKKSYKFDIPFSILEEVYKRGYSIWNEDFGGTKEQFAFDRVNSFIAGGFASDLDRDLMEKRGLWDNIWAKRKRIAAGSGEKMRKPGSKGAPTKEALIKSQNEEYIDEASFSDRRTMEKHLSSNNFVSKGGTKHERWEHPSGEVIYLPRQKTFADGIVYKTLKAVKKAQGLAEAKLDKKVLTPNQISNKFKVPVTKVLKQLNKGEKVEHEHASSDKTARRIASAHVSEKPNYYNILSKMEKGKMNEKIMTEPHSKDKNKSASRFDASDELVYNYIHDTPGQTKRKITEVIKKVIHDKLNEIAVRDASGHKTNVKNVPIRMADGTIKKLPPGKSGSSGGGGNGSESGITEAKTPAWQRSEGKDPKGGLNKKGVASYRAEHPGSKLQTAVTTEPSKLKPGSKKAKRRLSFCARSGGQMKMWPKAAKDPNSRLRKARRKWNC